MESIKQAVASTLGEDLVGLLRAVDRGDHHAIDGSFALAQFERLTAAMRPRDFIDTARDALEHLSRPQRLALGELMQAHARYTELNTPGLMKQGLQDPGEIALVLEQLRREDPSLVIQLLGSEFRDLPVMKLALGAFAAEAARRIARPPDAQGE